MASCWELMFPKHRHAPLSLLTAPCLRSFCLKTTNHWWDILGLLHQSPAAASQHTWSNNKTPPAEFQVGVFSAWMRRPLREGRELLTGRTYLRITKAEFRADQMLSNCQSWFWQTDRWSFCEIRDSVPKYLFFFFYIFRIKEALHKNCHFEDVFLVLDGSSFYYCFYYLL